MEIIDKNGLKILKATKGKMIKDINDNGEILEDGTIIEPYLTDIIYLGSQIKTLEEVEKLYEEVDYE